MKTLESRVRETGRGAKRFSAVLINGKWVRVSDHPNARYIGRDYGEEVYELDLADDAITANFYRSNSGREHVDASNGMEWNSFDEADRWAKGEKSPVVCPCCGRMM